MIYTRKVKFNFIHIINLNIIILIAIYLFSGHITAYFLYHNEVLIYQGLLFSHLLSGLEPFSLHTFRVLACTVKGCGSSRLINGRTLEAKPNGFVVMEAKIHDSRTISVKWTPPDTPNGLIHYNIFLHGLFYKDPGEIKLVQNFLITIISNLIVQI